MDQTDHKSLTKLDKVDRIIKERMPESIEMLRKLCAIPSVTLDRQASAECADLVEVMLQQLGLQTKQFATKGNPIVFGEAEGKSDKTILFYLHYDVQAPDPIADWSTPPFILTERGDKLYARGAADDKGHLVSRLAALAALRESYGYLPCNVKFIVEGEEEEGSLNIAELIKDHTTLFAADGCVWEFGGVNLGDQPVQILGMRGICYVDLTVKTASRDAHSGLGGSIFPNAAWRLVWALNTLKDQNERIRIPGFFDDVVAPTARDLEILTAMPDESSKLKSVYGLNGFLRSMTDPLEINKSGIFEPSCTICGLDSGYQGPSSKTVLPAKARAKVDFRLVPNQDPDDIHQKLRHHLDLEGFGDIEIKFQGGTKPARTDPDDPFVLLTNQAAFRVYERWPSVQPMSGGSGPNHVFVHTLKLPVVSAGVGYPGSAIHAPNEHIRLHDFEQGIRHIAYLVEAMGRD